MSGPRSAVLVTGASSGIGLAVTERLIAQGTPVVGVGRRRQILDDLECRWPQRFCGIVHDLSVGGLTRRLDELPARFREFRTFVHAAGCARQGRPLDQMGDADIIAQIDSNVLGLVLPLRDIAAKFRSLGSGHIVVVSSIAAVDSAPGMAVYAATKAFSSHLVRSLRADMLGSGIRVTCLELGTTRTPLLDAAAGMAPIERYSGFEPLEADDIAQQILWITAQPGHVNIQDIRVTPTSQAMWVRGVHRQSQDETIASGRGRFADG